jgi:hypothetical protein
MDLFVAEAVLEFGDGLRQASEAAAKWAGRSVRPWLRSPSFPLPAISPIFPPRTDSLIGTPRRLAAKPARTGRRSRTRTHDD